jgi:hypothetical protein
MAAWKVVQFGAAALLILCLVVFAAAWKVRGDASVLLAALTRMISRDSTAEFEGFIKRYGAKLKKDEHCTALECQYLLEINNRVVSWTHLIAYTELRAYLTIFRGRFEFFFISFRQEGHEGNSPVVHVQFVASDGVPGAFSLNPHGRSNELWNGMIHFNLAANPRERHAALNLNLNCFVKLGGCHDIAEMSPEVWKITSPAVIYSRMPSGADTIGDEYAP